MTTHAHLWQSARDLLDLGELTAQWLEGRIDYLPAYGGGPDPETADLVPALATANRAGFVTHFSQPGVPITEGCGQRAAVGGFCGEALANRIQTVVLGTDLVALVTSPGQANMIQIPITLDCGEAFTWLGGQLDEENLEFFYSEDCPKALDALKAAWQVEMLDPVWGRDDLLWGRLAMAWT